MADTDKVFVTRQLIFSAHETIKAGDRVVFYDVVDGVGTIMGRGGVVKGVSVNRLALPPKPMKFVPRADWAA